MYCPECGKYNPEDLQNCRFCNAELVDNYLQIDSTIDSRKYKPNVKSNGFKAYIQSHQKAVISVLVVFVLAVGCTIAGFTFFVPDKSTDFDSTNPSMENVQTTDESAQTSYTEQNTENTPASYYELYQPIIDKYYAACQENHADEMAGLCFCACAFYDINEDGVDEMIIEDGVSYGGRHDHFYTINNNEVVEIGEYAPFHAYLYCEDKKIYAVEQMQGMGSVTCLTFTENGMEEEIIGTYDNYDDMPSYSNSIVFTDLFSCSSAYQG